MQKEVKEFCTGPVVGMEGKMGMGKYSRHCGHWTYHGCLQRADTACMFPLRSAVVDCGSQAVADNLENFR